MRMSVPCEELGNSIPGRGNCKCKSPEVGNSLAPSQKRRWRQVSQEVMGDGLRGVCSARSAFRRNLDNNATWKICCEHEMSSQVFNRHDPFY